MTTAIFKIGMNKGKRRLWIDGRRLSEAGFVGGLSYRCDVARGKINMSLSLGRPGRLRKVSGRPDGKPIIDMLGRDVETAFPSETHVAVHFGKGRIQVTRAPEREEDNQVCRHRDDGRGRCIDCGEFIAGSAYLRAA